MKSQAQARNLSISAQKLRLQVAGIRGQQVQHAMVQLAARPHKGAAMVFDVVKSATANATNNHNMKREQLYVEEIFVDQAGKLKRWRPRSRGMASPIMHPKAHLTVIVSDEVKQPEVTTKKPAVNAKKKGQAVKEKK